MPAAGAIIGFMITCPMAVGAVDTEQAPAPAAHLVAAKKLAPPLPAVTEDVMWKKYNEYGMTAYTRGSLPEAARMFRNAFKDLQKKAQPGAALGDSKDLRLANVMTNLGAVYRDMGKDASAEQLLKAAIEIKRRQLKPTDPSLLLSLKHYAKLLCKTHRETEGELLDSRADMIAWSQRATQEELRAAEQWSPRPAVSPFTQAASLPRGTRRVTGNPFESGSEFDPWSSPDDWTSPTTRFTENDRGDYGFPTEDFQPKRLVFRGVSPDDPDVPTWKARVAMQRRFWNGQVYPVIGNGPPMRPGPIYGECNDYRATNRYANPPVVIAPWTSPPMAGRPLGGPGGPQGFGYGGGFGVPCGRPAIGFAGGFPAPMRSLGPGGR
jgi:hypothetical protein